MLSTMIDRSFDASNHERISELGRRVMQGGNVTREEGQWLFALESPADIYDLLSWANRIASTSRGIRSTFARL